MTERMLYGDEAVKSNGINFRDREAAIAALVGRVFAKPGIEITEDDYAVPLPCELRELLKFWVKVAVDIDIDYYRFLTGNIDGCDTRCRILARERIEAIRRLLGSDEVADALEEVRQELGRFENPHYWAVFWDGTPEEKNAVQKEARRLELERIHREVA